jgi:hypothetical protein
MIVDPDYSFDIINHTASGLFDQRRKEFLEHFEKHPEGRDYSFKFPEVSAKIKTQIKTFLKCIFSGMNKITRLRSWINFKNNSNPAPFEEYKTRFGSDDKFRQTRFTEQNDRVQKMVDDMSNSNPVDLLREIWVDHRLPKVFVSMK